jgi:hypothetical protein
LHVNNLYAGFLVVHNSTSSDKTRPDPFLLLAPPQIMNGPANLSKRLLQLFPAPFLKDHFQPPAVVKKRKDIVDFVVSNASASDIEDFVFSEFGAMRQHVAIIQHGNQLNYQNYTVPLLAFARGVTAPTFQNKTIVNQFVRHIYNLVTTSPTGITKREFCFDWPIQIEITPELLIVKMAIVHNRSFLEIATTEAVSADGSKVYTEQQILSAVTSRYPLIVGRLNIAKGIKQLCLAGTFEPERVSLIFGTGLTASYKTPANGGRMQTTEPTKFNELMSETLESGAFSLPAANRPVKSFISSPQIGEMKFFNFPVRPSGVEHIIANILAKN